MREYGSRHYFMYSTLVVLYLLAGVYGKESETMKDKINLNDNTPVDSYVSTDYNYEYEYRPYHGPGLLGVIVLVWRIIKQCGSGSNSETTEGEETADDESKLVV